MFPMPRTSVGAGLLGMILLQRPGVVLATAKGAI